MEEKEALLYKENNTRGHLPRNSTCKFNEDGDQDVSSEDSDEWWEESQSGCSSCCDHSSSR